jgi:guanylate kinase
MSSSEPLILIVSGPSGSGKSTLVQKILQVPDTMLSISCTTPPPRKTESDGKWYNFVSEAEFQEMIEKDEFLEYAQVFGKNWYGTPRKWLDEAVKVHKDLVLEIDVQGALQVKQKLPSAVAIFVLPPSRQDVERRIRERAQDSEDEIRRRLERARQELVTYKNYDFAVVNDELERAGAEVQAITRASRCDIAQQQDRIREILKSFGG